MKAIARRTTSHTRGGPTFSEAGISERLHIWPDHKALGSKAVIAAQPDPEAYLLWLESWWKRVSE